MNKTNENKLQDLYIEDLGKVTGGKTGLATTLAVGEEDPVTTLAVGEEDPQPTTLAIGEEDPMTTLAIGEEDDGELS
ncbi:hypothetical protein G6O69_24810 [Pseudenhygromyxa sp. WMMC2535]|uniref:hypothetical protein n=1 Tax=Pseudenhygromyxa sp. WMMC2535 TaxID=2712867 RepID=UPI001555A0D7|nr:hypothetical protein [Pseudenhygromyxa sp. WMMC2535]NVB41084.1 hypothetical protein [Pseudenhygromyxa sp. WMMC2535]